MKLFLSSLSMLWLISTTASAQWVYQDSGGDFGDDGLHMALAADQNYGVAIRCKSDMLEMVYLTPERLSDGGESVKAIPGAQLKVRIDSGEIHEISAVADVYGDKDQLGFSADIPLDLVKEIGGAKSRVSYAVELLGQNWHEHRFSASGSSKAIKSLMGRCSYFSKPQSSE